MIRLIKSVFNPSSKSYRFLSFIWNLPKNYWKPRFIAALDILLIPFSELKKEIRFIQIGSNDGISGDPLYHHITNSEWSGFLIEPIPGIYKKLQQNYQNRKDLVFINCAIGKENCRLPLYQFDNKYKEELPGWYYQLASFDRNMLFKHGIQDAEKYITQEMVEVRTLSDIVTRYDIRTIDLIHIDTEGYDLEILNSINFEELNPKMIIYEFIHLSVPDLRKSLSLTKRMKYKSFRCANDIIAIDIKTYQALKKKIESYRFI